MAKSFSELADEIKRLNEQLQRLGKGGYKSSQLEDILKSMNQDLDSAKSLFDDLNDRVDRVAYSFDGIAGSLKDALKDLKGQLEATKQIQQSYNKLSSIADKLRNHQKNEYNLSVKKLKLLKEQAKQEVEELKRARQQLERKKKSVGLTQKEKEYYKEINQALNLKNSYLNQSVKHLEKEIKLEEKRADILGITQGMFKGIHGLMRKIGVESEAFDKINTSMREAASRGGVFKTAMAGLKATASELKDQFTSIPGSLAVITMSFKYLAGIANEYSGQIFEIQQGLGGTWEQSKGIRDSFKDIAESSEKLLSNQKDLITATIALNQSAGTFNAYGIKALDNFTKLTQVAGLTTDQAAKLQEYGDMYNKTSENIYDNIGKTKKGLLSNKHVLSQVLQVNGQLAAQYKNSPELLSKAVVQANKLGMTLEQAKKASSSLLDFESSIQSELEAELLTGKNINLEQARYLALMGDSAGAAKEMMNQVGGLEEFNRMNVIQQDALAKSMGMTSDELADALVKEKQMQELEKKRAGQSKELQAKVKALRDQGRIAEAEALEKSALEQGDVKLAEQKLGVQKEFEKSMESMKEIFVYSLAPAITSMAKFVTGFIETISNNPIAKTVLKAAGAAFAIGTVIAAVAGIGNIISKAFGGGGIMGMFAKRGSSPAFPLFVSGGGFGGGGGMPGGPGGKGKGNWKNKAMKGVGLGLLAYGAYNMMSGNEGEGAAEATAGGMVMDVGEGTNLYKQTKKPPTSLADDAIKSESWMAKGMNKIKGSWEGVSNAAVKSFEGVKTTVQSSKLASSASNTWNAAKASLTGAKEAITATKAGSSILSNSSKVISGGSKVLGTAGKAIPFLDLALGGVTGGMQGAMSEEEKKASFIRKDMGVVEGVGQGILTGGAERGSMISDMTNWATGGETIEKGGAADEALGVAGSAGRGALAGAAIGSVVPVVGTAVGAAVGGVVGAVAETGKLLLDEDSNLRKGIASAWESTKDWAANAGTAISDFASSSFDTLSNWSSEAASGISDFASSSWDTLKGWGGSLMDMGSGLLSGIGDMASGAWEGIKSIGGGIIDSVSGGISSAGDFISGGVSAVGDFLGFAEGGIVSTPTKAKIGEGGSPEAVVPLDQFYAKMDQVINAINGLSGGTGGGGDVYLDSQKVGRVINMNTRGIQ